MTMTIIKNQKSFKIEFNNKGTYFVTDVNGDVWSRTDSLRKAENSFKKIISNYA
tara:strand:- start:310 stop:471 length:162 start_codon:yes stop_codon:yes gene_type:complete